jgi:DNA-binding NtrC family response regulator
MTNAKTKMQPAISTASAKQLTPAANQDGSLSKPQVFSGIQSSRKEKPCILLLDADPQDHVTIGTLLPPESCEIICQLTIQEFRATVDANRSADVIVMNLETPVEEYFDVILFAKETCPNVEVILISRLADEGLWIESIQRGAYDLLSKPIEKKEFLRVLKNAVEKHSPS